MKHYRYVVTLFLILLTIFVCCACVVPDSETISITNNDSIVGVWESACNHPDNEKVFLSFFDDGTMLLEVYRHENKLYETPGTYSVSSENTIKYELSYDIGKPQKATWMYLIEDNRLYLSQDNVQIDTETLEKNEQYYIRSDSEYNNT